MKFIEFGQSKFGDEFGWQAKYAEALGISQQQISDILAERSPIGPKMRERLRQKLNYDIDVEIYKTENISSVIREPVPNYAIREYPVAGKVKAGKGALTFEFDRVEPGPPGYMGKEGWWFIIDGDSMQPKYEHGEMVFASRDQQPDNNGFGIVVWDDYNYGVAKRVEYKEDFIILKSVNPSYETAIVKRKDLSFLGKILFTKHL